MTHEANCNYWTDHDEFDCTCGIAWKTRWQTEREMYRAWRKRAEEAEAVVAALRECVELYAASDNWLYSDSQCHLDLWGKTDHGYEPAKKCLEELKVR